MKVQVRMHKVNTGNYRVETIQIMGKGNGPAKYLERKTFKMRKDAVAYAKQVRAYYKQ